MSLKERQEGKRKDQEGGGRVLKEKKKTVPFKPVPLEDEHHVPRTRRQCPSKLPSTPHEHIITISYIMCVGLWAIDTEDDNRITAGQSHAAPQSCFLIINIILTYFNDALNSSGIKQCALSVPGYEHSVAHKNNLTTPETNPILEDGWMIPVARITSQEYCSTYITKSF